MSIPKQVEANLQWRREIIALAETDTDMQQTLLAMSAESLLFWTNAFAWTFRVFDIDETGHMRSKSSALAHLPLVTWEIQDTHLLKIEDAINVGYDLLTDKSRDMGASWNHIVVLFHQWLFKRDRNFLAISRKESCVDSTGKKGPGSPADPGTIFGKLDYLLAWLPEWMKPPCHRTTMHLVNAANRSRIDGESANATAAASDRRTAILLDEMAKMSEGESIKRSTRDVTACRLANSTPHGAGTAFSQWRFSNTVELFILPWWEHPEKGLGRHVVVDPETRIEKIRSPWYNIEEKLRTPKEMATEIDMNHVGSGDTFFDASVLTKHRTVFVRPPILTGLNIYFKENVSLLQMPKSIQRCLLDDVMVRRTPNGPWSFWIHLVNGRPDQSFNYIFAADIGKGMMASNSTIAVGCVETGKKIAEFASAVYAPHDFAQIVAAAAIWFGGSQRGRRPYVLWEANGDPGIYFGRTFVRDLRYPHYYRDRHAANVIRTKRPKQYGWHSSADKKAELLGDYRRALAHGTFANPSAKAIDEAATYVHLPDGNVGPAELQEESGSARKTHGDRVIADALLHLGFSTSKIKRRKVTETPLNTWAGRYQDHQRRKNVQLQPTTWDTRG